MLGDLTAERSHITGNTRLRFYMSSVNKDLIFHFYFYRRLSDGNFLVSCEEVSKNYPDIEFDDILLDRLCLKVKQILYILFLLNLFILDC